MNTALKKPMELIDTQLSGNAWKVRLMAGYLGIPLKRTTLSIVDGDLDTDGFALINPVRQVPVLRTREGRWLSESPAILWYLSEGSRFSPRSHAEQAEVIQWLTFEQTQHMYYFAQPRLRIALRKTMELHDPQADAWREMGHKALRVLEAQLNASAYLVGAQPSIADVALYPYTSMAAEGGYDLTPYAAVQAWLDRMGSLPGYTPLVDRN